MPEEAGDAAPPAQSWRGQGSGLGRSAMLRAREDSRRDHRREECCPCLRSCLTPRGTHNSTKKDAISSSLSTLSTSAAEMAAAGILPCFAVSGSGTTVKPPLALIFLRPADPSRLIPFKTTHIPPSP